METFLAYKKMLIEYLERFVRELVLATALITELIVSLESKQIHRLLAIVARRELADAFNPSEAEREERHASWQARWRGLRGWFIGGRSRTPQAQILRSRALQAIPDLLSVVAAINERRTTRGDRLADLRKLALWFAECDNDADAHCLWRAAFGLHPSRHLLVNGDTLAAWESDPVSPQTSWLEAPRLHISPRLRQYGSTRRGGRSHSVLDRSTEKHKLALLAVREAEQLAKARARLAGDRSILLSDLHVLEPVEFDLFFDLLTHAIAAKNEQGDRVVGVSSDGTMEIVFEPLRKPTPALVRTSFGTLTAWECRIAIRDIFASAPGAREPAPEGSIS